MRSRLRANRPGSYGSPGFRWAALIRDVVHRTRTGRPGDGVPYRFQGGDMTGIHPVRSVAATRRARLAAAARADSGGPYPAQ